MIITQSGSILWGQIDVIDEQGRDAYAKHGRYEEQEQKIEFACLEFLNFLFLCVDRRILTKI